ncbi:MAG: redoxin domain-containing protein [Acidobacteriota bacterium]
MRPRHLAIAACLVAGLAAGSATAAERPQVGDTAPDFSVQATDGNTYALGQLRGGEKHLVLVFFRGAW